jgi:acyl-CoA thioesterase FadM
MAEWIETYRGVVNAWECDTVEHFTIAYYFERFAGASPTLFELTGEYELLGPAVVMSPRRIYTTFTQELRAGAGFHMLSGIVGIDERAIRLGHQVVDSASAQTVSWVMEALPLPASAAGELRHRLEPRALPWPGPEVPPPAAHTAGRGLITGRDRVRQQELDGGGRMSLSAHVHRFSAAGQQFLSSIGMTGDYMHQSRRGFSTLALDLRLETAAKADDRIDVETSIAHLGNTSLSYLHRMSHADGREIASLLQVGVHLDLDARRPTAMPPAIRDAISKVLSQS